MRPEWEIWVDTNISPAIAKWLADYTGYLVKSSYILDMNELDDLTIYKMAKAHGKVILLSKDADFPELISRLGSPPKLINIKIGNCDNSTLWNLIKPSILNALDILIQSETEIIDMTE